MAIIKVMITSDTALGHYKPELPIILTTDASLHGIGACLAHVMDNTERPIASTSINFTKVKAGYD